MEIVIEKFAMIVMKNRKRETSEIIELQNQESINTLRET